MDKDRFREEINKLVDNFTQKKDNSLKELESFRKDVLSRFDKKIDELTIKRNFFAELSVKKEQLKEYRRGVWKKICDNSLLWNIRYLVSMPFIYVLIIPVVIVHVFVEIYHQVCFRLYGIPRVNYKEYFVFDRGHLPYLNWLEKINCAYCSYVNCFVAYFREIAARTERYWCPIKHARKRRDPHSQYGYFVEFANASELKEEWNKLREFSEYGTRETTVMPKKQTVHKKRSPNR